ncbi:MULTISPECIES: hypothetical protein [unclassified Streptomyces]|uniref:hypothetical protein n=1 Tax=unclassified Streptomyces TaxID=2593676 RepID=UPI0037F25FDE
MRDRSRATVAAASAPDMDTALQFARTALDAPTRALMATIGETLRTTLPTLDMREVTRLAYASRAAADVHGKGTPRAVAATGRLLRHMPRVDWPPTDDAPITRAEYGMRLLRKAGRQVPPAGPTTVGRVVLGREHRATSEQDRRDYEEAEARRREQDRRHPGLG